jgi:hypothetical protein
MVLLSTISSLTAVSQHLRIDVALNDICIYAYRDPFSMLKARATRHDLSLDKIY